MLRGRRPGAGRRRALDMTSRAVRMVAGSYVFLPFLLMRLPSCTRILLGGRGSCGSEWGAAAGWRGASGGRGPAAALRTQLFFTGLQYTRFTSRGTGLAACLPAGAAVDSQRGVHCNHGGGGGGGCRGGETARTHSTAERGCWQHILQPPAAQCRLLVCVQEVCVAASGQCRVWADPACHSVHDMIPASPHGRRALHLSPHASCMLGLRVAALSLRSSVPVNRCMSTTAAAADSAKRCRMAATIGTHSGTFHCDEALGCWLLQKTQRYTGGTITRSRDPAVLAEQDVVIDVGWVTRRAAPIQPCAVACRPANAWSPI